MDSDADSRETMHLFDRTSYVTQSYITDVPDKSITIVLLLFRSFFL